MEPWIYGLVGCLALYGAGTLVAALYGRARSLAAPGVAPGLVSLLLVTKDREQIVESLLHDIMALMSGLVERELEFEIIAVDDGSRDDTVLILERLARKNRALRVLRVEPGQSAIQVGLVLCRSRVVLLCEAVGKADSRSLVGTLERLLGGDFPAAGRWEAARCG